ncbi:MAG: TonB-dependent receptor [Saprospiraceae bacterium]|nr:TonB-dependent receptor [Saprospiraceae bacterium]
MELKLQFKSSFQKLMMACLFLVASMSFVQAQQLTIKGTIVDNENDEPMIGVNVLVQGTARGTVTDIDGAYELQANPGETLVFSYTSYETVEVVIGTETTINLRMNQSAELLDEVVVIGYGTQNKRDITGSVVSIQEATLKEVPAPNMLNQLKGRAAGVSIVSNGSTPGSQGQIRIRGNRTLTTGNGDGLDGPLVVVDGIPFGGLNDINPDDIASMEILKDASATAIYGSRGAGGVILITTKRGKISKPVLTYDGYHGVTNVMGKYNVMNAQEYATFKDWAAKLNTASPGTTAYPLTPVEAENLAAGVDTDWQDLLYQTGYNTSHQLGLQGGVESTQYSVGLGYFNETGIIPNQDFKRMNMRATIDQKLGKRVKIGFNTINTLTYTNTPGGGGVPGFLVGLTPLAKPYNEDGSVNLLPKIGSIDANQVSPLTLISRQDDILNNNRSIRTFNSMYGEVQILDGLKYRFNAGLNFSQSHFNGYAPVNTYVNNATVQSSSSADLNNNEFWDVNFQHLLYYDKIFAKKHKLGLTALFEATKNHNLSSNFNVRGVPADYIKTANFSLAQSTPTGGGGYSETGLLSYMGRANYTYAGKYMVTATFRRDGSSTLSPGNQWFNYPAIGLGWNVSDEAFMKNADFISNLKLRGGWGISGNRNVGAYATLGALSSSFYNFGTSTAGQVLGYTVTNLPASDLGWQSTSQTDLGLEIGLFKNRVTGSFDVYQQKTKDILLSVSLPPSNGAGSTLKNLGKTEGKGFESSVSVDILQSKDGVNWGVDLLYFFNREKITQLTTPEELNNIGNGWFVGHPLTVIYDYNFLGIWQTADEADGSLAKQTSPVQKPGQVRVEDLNNDGKIDAADRQVIGNFQPKWEGGFTNRIYYKNFDFTAVAYARMGQKTVVSYISGTSGGGSGFSFFNQGRSNQYKVDYWTPENPSNTFPRPDANGGIPDFGSVLQYRDGSFIKMRSMNLGYTFNNAFAKKAGISGSRVYLNVTNPFIIYSPLVREGLAIDPEGNNGNANGQVIGNGVPGRQITVSLNNPPVRQFTFGVNLKF